MALFVLRKLILQTHMRNAQPSTGARCQIFGQTLRLLPYFMFVNSEGCGETTRMRRLTWAFAGCLCDKYHNLMSWLSCGIFLHYSKVYKTEVLLPTLQSVARRLGQGEMYEGIALNTDPLVMPKGASEIEVRAKQVGYFLFTVNHFTCISTYSLFCDSVHADIFAKNLNMWQFIKCAKKKCFTEYC